MYPILLHYNNIIITSFGLFLTIAFVVFMVVLVKLTHKKGLEMEFFSNHIFSLFLSTILGAKLLYWIFNYDVLWTYIMSSIGQGDYFAVFKYLFNIEQFYVIGGLIAFTLLFYFYAKKHAEPLLKWMDVILPSLSLAFVFGYIGSFLGGYFVGKPSPSFPGLLFTGDPNYSYAAASYIIPIHPIQLYGAIVSLIIFFILFEISKKVKVDGVVGTLGLFLLSLQSFLIEFLRGNDNIMRLFDVTINQYGAIVGMAFAVYLFTKKLPKITG
ncbi:MAG: prolipoprotein diacylglyceryl transferase [Candidatus Gracilibacteria bacterium]